MFRFGTIKSGFGYFIEVEYDGNLQSKLTEMKLIVNLKYRHDASLFRRLLSKVWQRTGRIGLSAATVLLIACQVEYHPYDTHVVGETGINTKNITRIESSNMRKREIRFAVIGDTQRWYDETKDAVAAINRQNNIDFVIHMGDMADFGMHKEFERQRDILNRLEIPYVVLLGNHDCLATGEQVFTDIFGEVDFAFTAGCVCFVCLNTNALEFGHNASVPNFRFLEQQLAAFPQEAEKTVVAMHSKPFTEQFDNNVAGIFQRTIREFPALQFCINGHGHNFAIEDIFNDGVIYYECDNIRKRTYLLFTVKTTKDMIINGWNIKQIVSMTIGLLALSSVGAQSTNCMPSEKIDTCSHQHLDFRSHRGYEGWERSIPTHVKLQYAGGMGFMSFGVGWDYGRKCRWETDILIGILPKVYSDQMHMTFTFKQNYIPWNIRCCDQFTIEPFSCGI